MRLTTLNRGYFVFGFERDPDVGWTLGLGFWAIEFYE